MATCSNCGCKFDLNEVIEEIDEAYGDGMYNSCYSDGLSGCLCYKCAFEDIGDALGTYDEMSDYMACD